MSVSHPIYRRVFVATVAIFAVAIAAGTLQSIRIDRRPPVPDLDYGGWVRQLLGRGDYTRAVQEMRVAMKLDATLRRQDAHLALGQALARAGNPDEAIAEFRAALAAEPRNAVVHVELGNALAGRGDIEAAAAEYALALEIDPGLGAELRPRLAWARGGTLRAQGRYDEAIASYRDALAARADLAEVRFDLGITLAARGALDDAVREFQELVRQRPNEARFHNALGMAFSQLGRSDDAVAAYRRGLQAAPDDAELRRNLAVAEARRARAAGASHE